ncbi:MAG TPA: tyrosine-type recombinase/integrase, partial [Edaphobacter sp.]|nr:tyrosine-type recombinase/integrase [Edaphobacter sp.]
MIFKRNKSAYWYYDFTLAGDRYRRSTKEKTKNAAQAYEAALRTRISERGPSALPKRAPQFREFVPAFRGFIKHHTGLSPKSKAYYEDGIGLLLNSSVASMRLDHIKRSHIQTLQLPGSASWQNCALRTLRRMLAIAKEWGLLWEVPTVPLLEQRQRRDVSDQEVEIQIAAEARQPLQDVFITMMDTGCRPGEVLALRWEDILWDLGVIFVRRGKTKKSIRYVPMSDRVRDRLAARVEAKWSHGLRVPLDTIEGEALRDWAARHDRNIKLV